MTQSATSPSVSRSQARASVWAFLDVNADAATHLTGPTGLLLYTVSADRLIRRGIPSRVVSPLGDFLGLAKGTLACLSGSGSQHRIAPRGQGPGAAHPRRRGCGSPSRT